MPSRSSLLRTATLVTTALLASVFLATSYQAQDAKKLSRPDAPAHGVDERRKFELPELPEVAETIVRYPTISPDGKTMAFVTDGDIFSVKRSGGVPKRLTVTEDNEFHPIYSPDGRWLAFRSMRYGGYDVFIMPAEGGSATRLTWHDATDDPCCWLPDSSGLIFASARRNSANDLWVVRLDGSEPWPITNGGYRNSEFHASVSPNGKKIAYVRGGGSGSYRRRGYNGTSSNDIWVCDFDGRTTSNHRAIVSTGRHESWPLWGDDDVVLYAGFTDKSPRYSKLLAYSLSEDANMELPGAPAELYDLRELSLSEGGIAFTTGAYGGWKLGTIDLEDGSVEWPNLDFKNDMRNSGKRLYRQRAPSEFAASPDGKLLAFVAGNELYLQPATSGGVPRRLTDNLVREGQISFSPDSKQLLYTAERDGVLNIVLRDLASNTEKQLTKSTSSASSARFTPDGKTILFCEGEREIRDMDLDGKLGDLRIPGEFHGDYIGRGDLYSMSPKGRWLAFSAENELGDSVIVVADLHNKGKVHRISHLFGDSYSPSWSQDAKRLTFVSNQAEGYDVYVTDLQRPSVEFAEDKLDEAFKKKAAKASKKEPSKKGEGESKEAKPEPAKKEEPAKEVEPIDFDELDARTRRITAMTGSERSPHLVNMGKTVIFLGSSGASRNLYSVNVPAIGGRASTKQLTSSSSSKSQLRLTPSFKFGWMIDNNRMTKISTAGKSAGAYSVNVSQRRDVKAMWSKVLQDADYIMRHYYYDPNMHGIEWKKLVPHYAKAIQSVSTDDDFSAIMNELLGELNSSHQGYTHSDPRSDGYSESLGHIGLHFDAGQLADGHYLVTEVIKNGPCDYRGSKIKAGDYLVGVNQFKFAERDGRPINLARFLLDSIGKKTELHFSTSPDKPATYTTPVKPTTSRTLSELYYQRWVKFQRDYVHKLSDGKLGYVHIRRQDGGSLEHFKHHLGNDNEGRKGMVIDVRFNGGGSTAVHQLEILYKKRWLLRQSRGSDKTVSENIYRSTALEKPSCLLINGNSFSNAEILAEGFRHLKIGPIIGVPTGGGVIGTTRVTLFDGTTMRLPLSGAYAVNGENLENNGRKPDHEVLNHPADLDNGADLQTATAVSVLLEKMSKK